MLNSHVLKFLHDPETKMVHSVEQSSMKNKSYKVTAVLGDSFKHIKQSQVHHVDFLLETMPAIMLHKHCYIGTTRQIKSVGG